MRRILILFTLALVLLTACGGAADEDPAASLCAALTELNATGPQIAALGDVADLAQIVQLGSAMDENWRSLAKAVDGMDEATQTTFSSFDDKYDGIPAITQETEMAVARKSLDAKNTIITDTYNALYPENCP